MENFIPSEKDTWDMEAAMKKIAEALKTESERYARLSKALGRYAALRRVDPLAS